MGDNEPDSYLSLGFTESPQAKCLPKGDASYYRKNRAGVNLCEETA